KVSTEKQLYQNALLPSQLCPRDGIMKQRFFLSAVLIIGFSCYAQAYQSSAALSKAADAKPTPSKAPLTLPIEKTQPVVMKKFETPPVIDGKLDEEVWKNAVQFKDFYQVQPGDNIEPSQKTEVLMGYDSKYL